MELGKRIKALRKELRLTLDELGKKSGLAKATLSKIETGKLPLFPKLFAPLLSE